MDIGKPERVAVVEPVVDPIPAEKPEPQETPEREAEKVGA